MGLVPVFSEAHDFPVKHDLPATESCYAAVKQDADIMVLILGGRYGAIEPNGRSVTHNEYEYAKAAGIPVLVVVERGVFDLAPLVKRNPDIDLGDKVEDIRVFDFLEDVVGQDQKWVFQFSKLEEIEQIVVSQLAGLFADCLASHRLLHASPEVDLLPLMGPVSREILLRRGDFWEFDLLASLLDEYFRSPEIKFKELERFYGVGLQTPETNHGPEEAWRVAEILQGWNARMLHCMQNWSVLINRTLGDAIGPSGESGTPSTLVFTARRLCDIYEAFLDESNKIAQYTHSEYVGGLATAYTEMVAPALDYLASTPELWHKNVDRIRQAVADGDAELRIEFTIPEIDGSAVQQELDALQRRSV